MYRVLSKEHLLFGYVLFAFYCTILIFYSGNKYANPFGRNNSATLCGECWRETGAYWSTNWCGSRSQAESITLGTSEVRYNSIVEGKMLTVRKIDKLLNCRNQLILLVTLDMKVVWWLSWWKNKFTQWTKQLSELMQLYVLYFYKRWAQLNVIWEMMN